MTEKCTCEGAMYEYRKAWDATNILAITTEKRVKSWIDVWESKGRSAVEARAKCSVHGAKDGEK